MQRNLENLARKMSLEGFFMKKLGMFHMCVHQMLMHFARSSVAGGYCTAIIQWDRAEILME